MLPEDSCARPYGLTLLAGEDMHDRREVLGRLAAVYVVVEGGPGTAHEAAVALTRGAALVPVARSGGVAARLYSELPCPSGVECDRWLALGDESLCPREVAVVVKTLVAQLL